MQSYLILLLCSALVHSIKAGKDHLTSTSSSGSPCPSLLIDVDNTLYRECDHGIEAQIVKNIHSFCQEQVGISIQEADELHGTYGSTVEGLAQTRWNGLPEKPMLLRRFYNAVYPPVNVSSLLDQGSFMEVKTGYSSPSSDQRQLRKLLKSLENPLIIASNSPSLHVHKVLQALGLVRVPWKHIFTPDASPQLATKAQPKAFFREGGDDCTTLQNALLLDDSTRALQTCQESLGIKGVHVKGKLSDAVAQACGWVDCEFDAIKYLRAKNLVDAQSLHRPTWKHLIRVLPQTERLVIVDVGAGLLSMLRLVLEGDEELPSLWKHVKKYTKECHYYAFEPNRNLEPACIEALENLGFTRDESFHWETDNMYDLELIYSRTDADHRRIVVHVRFWDYTERSARPQPTPHLIIGCCFADLIPPYALAASLLRRFLAESSADFSHTLVYFPITFCGVTQLLPPQPASGSIPSDTRAFALYSEALSGDHGHNLDPSLLDEALKDYGAELLSRGSSDWTIDPSLNQDLWKAMLYFFGNTAAPKLQSNGFDASSWIARCRQTNPVIHVSNIDLLYSFPHLGKWNPSRDKKDPLAKKTFQEILFTAPGEVKSVTKISPKLKSTEVRIQSICSLISSGTELKVFRGQFDDAKLDVNIKSMEGERMAYPLSYGYSLVGRVVECGADADKTLMGKLVFAFAAHASQVVVDQCAVRIVPKGIEPLDAVFMPSVETAISLVHDAHPRLGETVAVFGQGLIGLLVSRLLQPFQSLGTRIITFDTIPTRLAASAAMGSLEALLPHDAVGPFDVAIEVSGNARALQSAIDGTRDGGRIVVGSWYGNTEVTLKLGIDFHRSHKTIKTSQVSTIPAELTGTWSKERRFALTWDLVRSIQPSRLLTNRTSLDDAQSAYQALSDGREIAIAFNY